MDTTIAQLIDRYEVVLLDAFGVLNHSAGPMPGARELISTLRQRGQQFWVVTNDASKLPATSATKLKGYGLDINASDIITSV